MMAESAEERGAVVTRRVQVERELRERLDRLPLRIPVCYVVHPASDTRGDHRPPPAVAHGTGGAGRRGDERGVRDGAMKTSLLRAERDGFTLALCENAASNDIWSSGDDKGRGEVPQVRGRAPPH